MNKLVCQFTLPLLRRTFPNGSQTSYSRLARDKLKLNKVLKMHNPGIDNRMKVIQENRPSNHQTESLDLEDMESDFMEADKMYNSHKREILNQKEKNQLQIVERKYFKTSVQPNFLTWSEKEQIRYLHDTDELEWSVEKLSASFPATENVVRKIIKSRWKPDNSSEIVRHDMSVHKNWQLLHKGELEMDPNLKTHLLQFGKRDKAMPTVPNHSVDVLNLQGTTAIRKNAEFSNIIQSYKKSIPRNIALETQTLPVSNKPSEDMVKNVLQYSDVPKADTYTLDGSKQNKTDPYFTLRQYRQTFNSPPQEEYMLAETTVAPKTKQTLVMNSNPQNKRKQIKTIPNTAVIEAKEFLPESVNSENFLEKIIIPKNKWKEGGTYKVGDCYYDDDGEFLYKVPGMK